MNQHTSPQAIPFIDVVEQRRRLGKRIDEAVARVLTHCQFINGPEVARLEADLAAFSGAKHVVACATGEVVALLGATPVFVDVDETTFNIDLTSLKSGIAVAKKLGLRPKAIIPVDLFGQPADHDAIAAVAAAERMFILDDAAQSFGATYKGRPLGTFGLATTTSFFPAKPLGCYGDGGAIFTDDAELADTLRSVRVHGQGSDKYDNVRLGLTGRIDTVQAAILIEKLKIFPDEITARATAAKRYNEGLGNIAIVPRVAADCTSVWAQYTIRLPHGGRDALASALKRQGIPTAIYYLKSLHQQTAYRNFPVAANGLPVSEKLSTEVISLPMHAYLDESTQNRIIESVRAALPN